MIGRRPARRPVPERIVAERIRSVAADAGEAIQLVVSEVLDSVCLLVVLDLRDVAGRRILVLQIDR